MVCEKGETTVHHLKLYKINSSPRESNTAVCEQDKSSKMREKCLEKKKEYQAYSL